MAQINSTSFKQLTLKIHFSHFRNYNGWKQVEDLDEEMLKLWHKLLMLLLCICYCDDTPTGGHDLYFSWLNVCRGSLNKTKKFIKNVRIFNEMANKVFDYCWKWSQCKGCGESMNYCAGLHKKNCVCKYSFYPYSLGQAKILWNEAK